MKKPMLWTYGITTVPQRLPDLFPRTLVSLAKAGFDEPWLFIDGVKDVSVYSHFGLEITNHHPTIRTAGNWTLALWELYLREPAADMYAIFQDDILVCKNLRVYLERCNYPKEGYWNLITYPGNQRLADGRKGWYEADQRGQGAQALVFSHKAVTLLLSHQHMVQRVQNIRRGHKAIDGGVVTAFKKAGWKEYVHNPSLVNHVGVLSSMANRQQPAIESFRGEDFDAMSLCVQRKD